MFVLDTSVLVSAYARPDGHVADWVASATEAEEPLIIPEIVITGAVRILTNPRVFLDPLEPIAAIKDLTALVARPGVSIGSVSPRWWATFSRLVTSTRARANLVTDAAVAAHGIDQGGTVVTLDRDFMKFPELRYLLLEP